MASCHVRLTSLRSVEQSTSSCASYGRLSDHWLMMRVKHWSRRSSPVASPVDFKVATLVRRSLSGISPSYLPTTAVLSPMFASDDYVPQLPNMRCWL